MEKKKKKASFRTGEKTPPKQTPPLPPPLQPSGDPEQTPERRGSIKGGADECVRVYLHLRQDYDYDSIGASLLPDVGPLYVEDEHTVFQPAHGRLPGRNYEFDSVYDAEVESAAVLTDVSAQVLATVSQNLDTTAIIAGTLQPEQLALLFTRVCLGAYQHATESCELHRMSLSMYEIDGKGSVTDLMAGGGPSFSLEPELLEKATVRWSPVHGASVDGVLKKEISSARDCAHCIASSSIRASRDKGAGGLFVAVDLVRCSKVLPRRGSRAAAKAGADDPNSLGVARCEFQETHSTVRLAYLGPPVGGGEADELAPSLAALGGVVAGLLDGTGGGVDGSFERAGADELARLARGTPITHVLGEAFGGNSATHVFATLQNTASRLAGNAAVLQLLSRARCVHNAVWVNEAKRPATISAQRFELSELFAAEHASSAAEACEVSNLLDQQLREVEQRQSVVNDLERSFKQTAELRQLAEYEKLQKERMLADKRRVEENARGLIMEARRGQQQVVDRFARSEMRNRVVSAEKQAVEENVQKLRQVTEEQEQRIADLQQRHQVASRDLELEQSKTAAATKVAADTRRDLQATIADLRSRLADSDEENERLKRQTESLATRIDEQSMLRSMTETDKASELRDAQHEIRALQRRVTSLELEKKTMDAGSVEKKNAAASRMEQFGGQLQKQGIEYKRREVEYKNTIEDLEIKVEELEEALAAKEATAVRQLGEMQSTVKELQAKLNSEKSASKDVKHAMNSYRAEVEAEWSLQKEAMITSVEQGAQLLADFMATMPELKGSFDTMTAWLRDLNLGKYVPVFQSHGITDMKSISQLNDEDLIAMHVTSSARRTILDAAETIPVDDRDTSPASVMYAWLDSLYFRLTGEPAPSTPMQEYTKKPPAPRIQRTGPAFYQVRSGSLWTHPQKEPRRTRKYAESNEVLLDMSSTASPSLSPGM
ncbi:hypothetical protein DIPPA_33147 [Diplonema papillatum]|nr:hypothetical protein DIPPA_33147 [Diplonema papillatum]